LADLPVRCFLDKAAGLPERHVSINSNQSHEYMRDACIRIASNHVLPSYMKFKHKSTDQSHNYIGIVHK